MTRDSASLAALDLLGGADLVLQRVPRATSADAIATRLVEELDREGNVVHAADTVSPGAVRVLDGRALGEDTFSRWDRARATLAMAGSPLVVLLNVEAGRRLLRAAPHVASWAGGVRLPAESVIQIAQSEAQLEAGRAALSRALQSDPALAVRAAGRSVGVVIGSDRVFVMSPDASVVDQARCELDEGLLYVARVGDE